MIEVQRVPVPVVRSSVRRIAVFRALQLGDLLLSVPALRSLRAGFPDAEITLIGLPWARSFTQRFRCSIDRFVEFAGYPGLREIEVDPERVARSLEEQRAYRYDLAIQMHGSGRISNHFVLELGAGLTAGYYEGERPAGLSLAAPYPGAGPEIERNLALVRLLGCPDLGSDLHFPLFDQDRAEASTLLRGLPEDGSPRIGLHPGARPPARRWPAERFAAVADDLARRCGAAVVLTAGPGEKETACAVERCMVTAPLNLAERTSLGGLAAVIDRLDLFISNDTGPAHIADAVDTPSVTIVGPADPRRWAPLNARRHPIVRQPVPCSPCPYTDCPIDHRCLRRIQPQTVVQIAEHLLVGRTAACNA